jgi:hypothetical protein
MRHFSAADIPKLKRLHAEGMDDFEIAKVMGFHRSTINRFRHRKLQLSANGPHTARACAKRSRKLKRIFAGEGRYFTATRYRVLAAKLGWPGRCVREAFVLYALERLGPATTPQIAEKVSEACIAWGRKPLCATTVCKALAPLQQAGFVSSEFLGAGKGWKVYQLTELAQQATACRLIAWQK